MSVACTALGDHNGPLEESGQKCVFLVPLLNIEKARIDLLRVNVSLDIHRELG